MPTAPSKPCHNCRRRRLRCDRSWPSCHKCAVSGQECLGYGKVFVWTQPIDTGDSGSRPSSGRTTPAAFADSGFHPTAGRQQWLTIRSGPTTPVPAAAKLPVEVPDALDANAAAAAATAAPESKSPDVSAAPSLRPTHLTDPVFQDLDRNSRYYLAHCKFPQFRLKSRHAKLPKH